MSDPLLLGALVLWGTLTGVDLVSFPQGMLNRPLVAATVAGLLIGNLTAGLAAGMLLECFALDVLPIGASRYPDYGPGAVVSAYAGALLPGPEWAGGPVVLGLLLAVVAGRGMESVRRFNGWQVRRAGARLAAGEAATIARIQRNGLLADAARSAAVTAAGLGLAALLMPRLVPWPGAGSSLTLVAVAGALVAALTGAVRRAGTGAPRWLLLGGLAAGGLLGWLA